jgi:hypothetical protein
MTKLSPDMHAFAVRNELSDVAFQVHRITRDAGADLADALTALADIEQLVAATRKALLELPAVAEES